MAIRSRAAPGRLHQADLECNEGVIGWPCGGLCAYTELAGVKPNYISHGRSCHAQGVSSGCSMIPEPPHAGRLPRIHQSQRMAPGSGAVDGDLDTTRRGVRGVRDTKDPNRWDDKALWIEELATGRLQVHLCHVALSRTSKENKDRLQREAANCRPITIHASLQPRHPPRPVQERARPYLRRLGHQWSQFGRKLAEVGALHVRLDGSLVLVPVGNASVRTQDCWGSGRAAWG